MEVILMQDVKGLGKAGSVVKVKDGFANNFLLLKKLAVPANQANLKIVEQDKKRRDLEYEKKKLEAQGLKERLEKLSFTMPAMVHDDEKIYGSITIHNIAEALDGEGFKIQKDSILLNEPLKSLGIFEVPVKLHPEITAKVKIWVVKK
ncbi:MAG: 50S ribosomal protein L9 [Candidatus Omnitrophota bacterium]|nr:50S ribosomal protein L9 [Candidatus Omnitrophota bacterium]